MNHPTQEQWLSYLYEEIAPQDRQLLAAHLSDCPECSQLIDTWQSTRSALDAWQISESQTTPAAGSTRPSHSLRWAAAAAVVLAAFGIGRLSAPTNPSLDELKAEIRTSVAAQLAAPPGTHTLAANSPGPNQTAPSQTEVADLIRLFREARQQDRQELLTRLQEIEQQRATDYASLRHDLETVAVQAENRIERTHAELGQLVQSKPSNP